MSSSADAIKYYGYLAYKFNDGKPIEVKFKTNATTFLIDSGGFGQGTARPGKRTREGSN